MATSEDLSVLVEELTCAVCLELYRDPHLLPCGHNFCKSCLRKLKSHSKQGCLSCPECRQSHEHPVPWQKNFKLASIADGYRKQGQPKVPSRKAEEVRCDYCPPGAADTAASSVAVKTCLKCEVSMCPEHVKPHVELPAFREHPLVEPLGDMKNRKCLEHDEMFQYYCLDERAFLCNACTIEGGHRDHCIKTLKNATKDPRASLDKHLEKLDRKIRGVEKNMQAQKEVEHQNKAFYEEADRQVQTLREALSNQLEGFLASLQACVHDHGAEGGLSVQQDLDHMAVYRGRLDSVHAEIQQLMQENDPFQFIKEYSSYVKRYRQILREPQVVSSSPAMDVDALRVSMEDKVEEFMTDLRQHVDVAVDAICTEAEGDEEEEEGDEGVEEEEEEDDDDEGEDSEEEETSSEDEEEEEGGEILEDE